MTHVSIILGYGFLCLPLAAAPFFNWIIEMTPEMKVVRTFEDFPHPGDSLPVRLGVAAR